MHLRAARLARGFWFLALSGLVVGPVLLCDTLPLNRPEGRWEEAAVDTGLVAFALLVVGVLLIARVRSIVSSFGIERVLRMHRAVAVAAVLLVLAHVAAVLVSDPRGLRVFDLAHNTPAARAAILATAALVAVVLLGLRRRKRQPRYEGWRLVHMGLAATVLGGAWLHVWWLHHLGVNLLFLGWLTLMALLLVGVAVRRWVWLPRRARRRPYVVEDVVEVAGDAVTLALRADRHDGIPFRAGQFAYLKVGRSPFVLEEHPFSISSTAVSPDRKEFTIKALGDFTELLRGLRPGREVYVDGAYGSMTMEGLDRAHGFVFIAGGIGITPMLSMLRTLADRGDRRPHLLLVGARGMSERLLATDLEELRERLDLDIVQVLDTAPDGWSGAVGRIDRSLLDRCLPKRARRHLEYFLCGPPAMVMAVEEALRSLAVTLRRIHTERFEVV